jgi:hypothetical protein
MKNKILLTLVFIICCNGLNAGPKSAFEYLEKRCLPLLEKLRSAKLGDKLKEALNSPMAEHDYDSIWKKILKDENNASIDEVREAMLKTETRLSDALKGVYKGEVAKEGEVLRELIKGFRDFDFNTLDNEAQLIFKKGMIGFVRAIDAGVEYRVLRNMLTAFSNEGLVGKKMVMTIFDDMGVSLKHISGLEEDVADNLRKQFQAWANRMGDRPFIRQSISKKNTIYNDSKWFGGIAELKVLRNLIEHPEFAKNKFELISFNLDEKIDILLKKGNKKIALEIKNVDFTNYEKPRTSKYVNQFTTYSKHDKDLNFKNIYMVIMGSDRAETDAFVKTCQKRFSNLDKFDENILDPIKKANYAQDHIVFLKERTGSTNDIDNLDNILNMEAKRLDGLFKTILKDLE